MTISALWWCAFSQPLPFLNHLSAYFLHLLYTLLALCTSQNTS